MGSKTCSELAFILHDLIYFWTLSHLLNKHHLDDSDQSFSKFISKKNLT